MIADHPLPATMKPAVLATCALALASCADTPRSYTQYPDDFLDRRNGSFDAADRAEVRTEHQAQRRGRIADFMYRRGTW